jgi:hypothetical protein
MIQFVTEEEYYEATKHTEKFYRGCDYYVYKGKKYVAFLEREKTFAVTFSNLEELDEMLHSNIQLSILVKNKMRVQKLKELQCEQ